MTIWGWNPNWNMGIVWCQWINLRKHKRKMLKFVMDCYGSWCASWHCLYKIVFVISGMGLVCISTCCMPDLVLFYHLLIWWHGTGMFMLLIKLWEKYLTFLWPVDLLLQIVLTLWSLEADLLLFLLQIAFMFEKLDLSSTSMHSQLMWIHYVGF